MYRYTHDYRNRLIKVESKTTGSYSTTAQYLYDALNRRVGKYTNTLTDGTVYLYDGWRVVEEREYYTWDTMWKWQPRRQYVYGDRYIDERLIYDFNHDDDPGEQCNDRGWVYAEDRNWNVVMIADCDAVWAHKLFYEPYGTSTIVDGDSPNSCYDFPYRFQGRYHDTDTGLTYFRNRWYHPKLGRFLQRDPIGYADGMSLYEAFLARPAVYTDGFGLKTTDEMINEWVDPHIMSYEAFRRGYVIRYGGSEGDILRAYRAYVARRLREIEELKRTYRLRLKIARTCCLLENMLYVRESWRRQRYYVPRGTLLERVGTPSVVGQLSAWSDAVKYALETYCAKPIGDAIVLGHIGWRGAVGQNLPLWPGFTLDAQYVDESSPLGIATTIVHESQHDYGQLWLGHSASGAWPDWPMELASALAQWSNVMRAMPYESCCREEPNRGAEIKNFWQWAQCRCRLRME